MRYYKLFIKFIFVVSFSLFAMNTWAQSVEISGIVTDSEDNSSLIGVNVVVQNIDGVTGTTTDVDGSYTLTVETGAVVEFSYTGYASQQFTIDKTQTINVLLAASQNVLDEVVIVGYGAVVKEDITGVVTKIGEAEFNKGVISSPEKLLVGKVAGLQINTSGEPGGATRLRIRGGTSINDGQNNPLIVIDGVPMDNGGSASGRNPLNFINAADVEDITILKDASAAAIYGSRGANGVIVITTKTGKGKLKVNYNGYYSISKLTSSPDVFSADEFRQAINAKAPQAIADLGDANTNWVDEVTQAASGQQHNVSMAGGHKKSAYYVSLNYMYNNGVLKTSKNTNSGIAVNLSTKLLNDALTINFRNKTNWNKEQFAPNVMGSALAFDPTQSVFDTNSPYGGYFEWNDQLATRNPLATLLLSDEKGKGTRTLNAIDFEYQLPFLEGLSFKTNLSYDYLSGEKSRLKDPSLYSDFINGGFLFTEKEKRTSKLLETYAKYKIDLPSVNSKIDYLLGYSWQNFDKQNRWKEGNGLEKADNEFNYMATTDLKQDSFLVENRLISFFTRLNYQYNDKYLLTLSLRRDGSTRFGTENRWGIFPAAALGWRVLQEDFAKGLNNVFTDLKFRISYGITGNQEIGDYLYATFYSYGTDDARYQFGDDFIRTLRGVGVDPNIKWESTASFNVGIDFGVWNNRLTGTVDVYQKNTSDLLFTVAAAAFTNLSDRVLTNISEVKNKGIELSLNTTIIDRSDFDWNLRTNIAYNQNKITKLDNSNLPEFLGYETGGISGDIGQTIQILKVGEPVNAFRTYKHILDANGNPTPDTEDRNQDGAANELDIYEDINGDGIINENDLVINHSPAPDWMLGLTSMTTYKNFDMSFTLRANLGNYVYNNNASSSGFFDRLSDRVTNNTSTSSFVTNFKDKQLKSDYYLENASFMKLDNITIGYTLNKLNLKRLRFYATVQNIFTITGYSGLDPEAPQFYGGIDNNLYPISATFLFGLNASF